MLSPWQLEIGTKATAAELYPIFVMHEQTSFLISSKRACVWWTGGVHLVDTVDQLFDNKGEGKQSMFRALSVLGDISFEITYKGKKRITY